MMYVANAFSAQMLPHKEVIVHFKEITEDEFQDEAMKGYSCIGNPKLSKILGIPYNKEPISLKMGDIVLLAQLSGGKLPESCIEIPDNVEIKYKKIKVIGECI